MNPNIAIDLLYLINETSVGVLEEIMRRSSGEDLEDRRANICLTRLGVSGDGDYVTLKELGNFYGISRERIRQIESKSIARLTSKLWRMEGIQDGLKNVLASSNYQVDIIAYDLISEINNRSNVEFMVALLLFCQSEGKKWQLARQKGKQIVSEAISKRSRWLKDKLREHEGSHKVEGALSRILDSAILQVNSQNSCEIELSKLHPLRNVSQEGYGASGNFYSEKNGRVVNYESYGEFFLYQLLEQSALISSYVEQPFSIPYAFGQISANYYPDVLTEFKDGRLVCIETKDPRRLADACTLAKAGAATRFLLEKNIVYCLVTSRLSSLKDIINEGHSALDDALLPIIDSVGFVGWSDVRNITSEGPLSRNAIASFILRNRLFHSKAPFRIRRCSEGETCQLFGSDLFN